MVVVYHFFFWFFVFATLEGDLTIGDMRLKSTPGRFLGFWENYGALLEFIPILWHYRLAYNKALANKMPSFTDDIFDPLRELVVEFLVKGINKSMLKGQQDFHKYYELLRNKGTVKYSKEGEEFEFDAKELAVEALEEENYNFPFRRNKAIDKLRANEFLLEDIEKLNKYMKVTVIAPKIFRSLRKYFGIDDNELASIFSIDKLQTNKLKIKLGSGHGGSFFIYPANMRFLLKTIKKPEFAVLRKILPRYFQHLAKGRRNFLNPVIALLTISVKGGGIIEPVHFLMMPNVLPFNRSSLPLSAKVLSFDIKGSLGQRLATDNPEKLLNFEALTKDELDTTYKDVDFLKSFRCLELDKTEAKPVILQLKEDTELLAEARLFDYSMMLFMILTPLVEAADLPAGIKMVDLKDCWKVEFPKKDSAKENPCTISIEVDETVTIRYTTTLFSLEFHICQRGDIEAIKSFLVNTKGDSSKRKLSLIKGPDVGKSLPLSVEEEKKAEAGGDCAEQVDFKEFPLPNKNVRLVNFPNRVARKEAPCEECKEDNNNHLIVDAVKEGIRRLGLYQLAIKDHGKAKAIYLFSAYTELIDYLTTYTLKRKIEKSLKTAVMKEPSVEEPRRYAERFMRCVRTVFCVDG